MPERIQLKRTKGWRMPPNTVKIDRSTRWVNPFSAEECGSIAAAVERHRMWMNGEAAASDGREPPSAADVKRELAGRNLACWCSLDGPCHGTLLLALANAS